MKLLFMCVANPAPSQIAEGLARSLFGSKVDIQSAGSKACRVNPLAIEVMTEIGVDLSKHMSKSVDGLSPDFLKDLTYVITLCAEEVCPVLISRAKRLHWPMPDPAGRDDLSHDEQLDKFRVTRDQIKKRLEEFKIELET